MHVPQAMPCFLGLHAPQVVHCCLGLTEHVLTTPCTTQHRVANLSTVDFKLVVPEQEALSSQ